MKKGQKKDTKSKKKSKSDQNNFQKRKKCNDNE